MIDRIAEFTAAMAQRGLVPTEAIKPDGRLHRVHVEGDPRGKRNAFYCLHLDGRPAGLFGCHKRGFKEDWKAAAQGMNGNGSATFTGADHAELLRKIAADKRLREEEQERRYREVADKAAKLWDGFQPAPADHAYLAKKGVQPHGAKVDDEGRLVVGMTDAEGRIWSLQKITADGAKRYMKDGKKRGCFFPIGEAGDRQVVAECKS